MISPTIGRIVWYYPTASEEKQAEAAIVCYVHTDRLVNLSVFSDIGIPRQELSVTLQQEEDTAPVGKHASWMPYQIGQAKKN